MGNQLKENWHNIIFDWYFKEIAWFRLYKMPVVQVTATASITVLTIIIILFYKIMKIFWQKIIWWKNNLFTNKYVKKNWKKNEVKDTEILILACSMI